MARKSVPVVSMGKSGMGITSVGKSMSMSESTVVSITSIAMMAVSNNWGYLRKDSYKLKQVKNTSIICHAREK